jgi:hypothetical protein
MVRVLNRHHLRVPRRKLLCIDRISVDSLGRGGGGCLYRVICDSKQASPPTQAIDRNSADTPKFPPLLSIKLAR